MTKTFITTIERDGEEIEISVTYRATSDEISIDSVMVAGSEGEVIITKDESLQLMDEANADFNRFQHYNR